ncbi:MAG: YnbE family lipoprotein [Alphaproteobacteria bacterium]|jgi:hypothetical protein
MRSPNGYRALATSSLAAMLGLALLLAACQPTVKIVPPDKPIVINLNIKIEQEVRIKVDKALDSLLEGEEDLF